MIFLRQNFSLEMANGQKSHRILRRPFLWYTLCLFNAEFTRSYQIIRADPRETSHALWVMLREKHTLVPLSRGYLISKFTDYV